MYIGADNKTHKLTTEYIKKVEDVLSKYWKGFTLTENRGCYEGTIEESITVVIYVLNLVFKDLFKCIDELKIKLIQDEIIYEITTNVDLRKR